MTNSREVYDVFLSSALDGADVALQVRVAFQASGLPVYSSVEVERQGGLRWNDEAWEAMAEAAAFVLLLTPASLKSDWTPFELGAALGGKKEIYLLCADHRYRIEELPDYLKRHRPRPLAELEGVISLVRKATLPLPDAERDALRAVYAETGASIKELSERVDVLDALTRKFNQATGRDFTPEHIFQELVRLRKRRQLPRPRRTPAVHQR